MFRNFSLSVLFKHPNGMVGVWHGGSVRAVTQCTEGVYALQRSVLRECMQCSTVYCGSVLMQYSVLRECMYCKSVLRECYVLQTVYFNSVLTATQCIAVVYAFQHSTSSVVTRCVTPTVGGIENMVVMTRVSGFSMQSLLALVAKEHDLRDRFALLRGEWEVLER